MFDALASLLAWFYGIWPSYGGAIILLTVSVMLVLTPLTLRGTRSMLRMQRLQPEMKRIQKEFKDDRQRMNEELMAFYRENQINPLSSCLPLLIQMPVFIVLYRVLHGITETGPDGTFDPGYISHSSELYQSLVGQTEMNWLGIDLAISPSAALKEGFGTFWPYGIMILVVLVSGYVQQRQIQGRNPQSAQNPQQQMIMRIMPAFIGVISFGLVGGLVLYFVTSNLFRVGQQFLITRTIYHADAEAAGVIEAHHHEKPAKEAKPPRGDDGGAGSNGKGFTSPKGKPTPGRTGGTADRSKGKNKRTGGKGGTTPALPQPRPRKKKR